MNFRSGKNEIRRLVGICCFPAVLVAIFIIQNYLFNLFLNIKDGLYFASNGIVTAALGILLFGPSLIVNKRFKYLYLGFVSLFVALIFAFQFLYYSYSGGFLQASALFYAGEGMTILATLKTLLDYRLIFFALGLFTVLAAWILSRYGLIGEYYFAKKEKLVVILVILALTGSGYAYIFLGKKVNIGDTHSVYKFSSLYDADGFVSKIGIVNFSLGDLLTETFHARKVNAAEVSLVADYKKKQSAPAEGYDFGLLKGRNLILIQVESLENAVIGQKLGGEEITPNLNALASRGMYFSNYYSPIGPGTTADAEFMTLNSLYSLPDSVAFIEDAYDHYDALPDLLKANGYHAYSFHGDVASFWNRANIYPQLGYDKFFSKQDYTIPRKIGTYDLGDEDFFSQSIPKLSSLPQPFMATLITLSSHTPFVIPDDLQTLDIPASANFNWLQKNYLESVHYADQAIGDFISQLKTAGLYDNSLILIYGDHGSFTGIADALGVKNNTFADLQTSQVPFILLAPGTSLSGTKDAPANHLDIYPTVAALLGIKAPSYVFGSDIVNGKDNLAVSRNLISGTIRSVLTNKLAYHAADDGVFAHGECLEMPGKTELPAASCESLYNNETDAVNASDLMVRGDMIVAH
jgi:phosphoglycerol transferase MdoB-like AlkP superfamily enzyme